jgi:hypothetical protein
MTVEQDLVERAFTVDESLETYRIAFSLLRDRGSDIHSQQDSGAGLRSRALLRGSRDVAR